MLRTIFSSTLYVTVRPFFDEVTNPAFRNIDKCTDVVFGSVPVALATSVEESPSFRFAIAKKMSSLVGCANALRGAIKSAFFIFEFITPQQKSSNTILLCNRY